MKESTRNLLVGVFVVLSMGALATLMVWFGETPSWLRSSEWKLSITGVSELSGIGEGSPVRLNGVEIGRVESLEFVNISRPDHGVKIVTGIKMRYDIPSGATARVYGATLGFGSGHVAIIVERGTVAEPLPKDGSAKIEGEMRSMIGELITKDMVASWERTITHIGNMTAEWTPVGTNLSALLERRDVEDVDAPGAAAAGVQPNLSTVLERIDRLIKHVNSVLGDEHVKEDMKAVVKDLKDASGQLKQLVELWHSESMRLSDNMNTGVIRIRRQVEQSFAELNQVLEKLDETARSVAVVLRKVENGEGTAGLLMHDERLYEAAVLSFERLGAVMLNLQVITGKIKEDGYITLGRPPTGFPSVKVPVATSTTQTE